MSATYSAGKALPRYAFVIAIAALLLAVGAVHAAQVTAARVWPSQEYSRVTLEASGPIAYRMFTIPDPARLVLDLELLESSTALENLPKLVAPNDPFIKSIRLGRFKPGTLRLVFDMKAAVRPEAFLLKPVGDYGYRLLLDVYSIESEDPIVALIRSVERERRAEAGPLPTPGDAAENTNELATESGEPAQSATVEPGAGANEATHAEPHATPKPGEEALPKSRAQGRRVIVAVDAGHGGEDPGASGREGTLEKHVTLQIARRLKARIDDEPGMRGVLIRDGDYFIPLQNRVAKARAIKADAFVSIHADSFVKPHARGSSVFALSERGATSAAARWIAKRENDADLVGGVNIDVADPYLKKVLLDLSQTATINDSLFLARAVLDELGDVNKLHKSHVEQAGFAVLKSPDIPSILVETAFISNPDEEKRLIDDEYQEKLAAAIFRGLRKYLVKQAAPRMQIVRAEAVTPAPSVISAPPVASPAAMPTPQRTVVTEQRPAASLQTVADILPAPTEGLIRPVVQVIQRPVADSAGRGDSERSAARTARVAAAQERHQLSRKRVAGATQRAATTRHKASTQSKTGALHKNARGATKSNASPPQKRKSSTLPKPRAGEERDCKEDGKDLGKRGAQCGNTTQKHRLASRD